MARTTDPGASARRPTAPATGARQRRRLAELRRSTTALHSRAAMERSLREALAAREAELADFARVAAHDLRAPLQAVGGFADLLSCSHGYALDERGRALLSHVVTGAEQMRGMLDDLGALLEPPGRELAVVELDGVVLTSMSALSMQILRSGAIVSVGPLPPVAGCAPDLVRLFTALLDNALKFARADVAEVEIEADEASRRWLVTVTDNGIGVPAQHRDAVFGLFQRACGSDRPGNGTGLAAAARVVRRHGGAIWLDSAPTGGTRVSFTLPQAREAA